MSIRAIGLDATRKPVAAVRKWGTPAVSESDLWQFASFLVEP